MLSSISLQKKKRKKKKTQKKIKKKRQKKKGSRLGSASCIYSLHGTDWVSVTFLQLSQTNEIGFLQSLHLSYSFISEPHALHRSILMGAKFQIIFNEK